MSFWSQYAPQPRWLSCRVFIRRLIKGHAGIPPSLSSPRNPCAFVQAKNGSAQESDSGCFFQASDGAVRPIGARPDQEGANPIQLPIEPDERRSNQARSSYRRPWFLCWRPRIPAAQSRNLSRSRESALNNFVIFGHAQATVLSVNPAGTAISVRVPGGLSAGAEPVIAGANGGTSNAVEFTIR